MEAVSGQSMVEYFESGTHPAADRQHADELIGKKGIRRGKWKLVQMPEPFGTGAWELYDLDSDPSERDDLAEEMPELVEELAARWDAYAAENGVILPDWVSGY